MARTYSDRTIQRLLALKQDGLSYKEIAQVLSKEEGVLYGRQAIKETYHRYQHLAGDEETVVALMKENARVRLSSGRTANENRSLVKSLNEHSDIIGTLKEQLSGLVIKTHKPIKVIKKKKSFRTIVAHLSDMHYGLRVDKEELDGLNEFNPTIAARRTALFVKQVAEFKLEKRDETDLVLVINGDILHGLIHDTDNYIGDLITTQFANAVSILTQSITYLATKFSKVRVVATPGNHERIMSKNNKARATAKKWDSYATMVYIALKGNVEKTHKNVSIEIPKSPYAFFEVQGHRMAATHGDTGFTVGNVSKALRTDSISARVDKINNSDLAKDGKFEVFLFGHVHCAINHLLDNGTYVIINGSLSGVDHFAQSIGIVSNAPSQTFFEVTKEFAVGDSRIVQVKGADELEELDAIIEPLRNDF